MDAALGEAGPFAAAAAYTAAAYSVVAGVGGVPPGAAALTPLSPAPPGAAAAASGKQAPSDGKRGRRGDGPLDDFPLNKGSNNKKRGTLLKVPPLTAAAGADDEATEALLGGGGAQQNSRSESTEAVGINDPGAHESQTPQRGAGAGAADYGGRGYPSTPPRSGGGIERQVSERTLAAIAAAEVRAGAAAGGAPGRAISTSPLTYLPLHAARRGQLGQRGQRQPGR